MTQEEKDSFIRFNALLEELKDIDASIEQVKVAIDKWINGVEAVGAVQRCNRGEYAGGR